MDTESNANIFSLIPLILWSAISLIPSLALCKRVGKTRWWAAVSVIPFVGPLILLFILAYSRWPDQIKGA
jgi:uncharacterized membrane protein YhaH (DUF805 family)